MRKLLIFIFFVVTSCSTSEPDAHPTRAQVADTTLPPMKSFSPMVGDPTMRSNRDLARDFLDLSFALESGRTLDVLTRFEGPITVHLTGRVSSPLRGELSMLLARLRTEANLPISMTESRDASVTVQAVPRREIKRALPHAACFVVPNVDSLADYRRQRNGDKTDWAALRKREKIAVFLPYDISTQEMRDCLHEELAQALGPLNDLYRLNDSVFNDDNFHAVLTGFDMLMLRIYYDPALENGMTRAQVAQRLPGILARLNPAGQSRASAPKAKTTRDWIDAIQEALGPGTQRGRRIGAAQQALTIARNAGWNDHRRGFSHFAVARLLHAHAPSQAREQYRLADRYYRQSVPNGPHRAFIATQLAAFALAEAKPDEALRLIEPNLPRARNYQNGAQLASLLLLKAEALDMQGKPDEARRVRLDSLGWARYGFGPEWAVRAKLEEIAALNPNNRSF
jgi:hypothetical protein